MKKMMLGLAASLCVAVTFGLESANIVGYANKTLPANKFIQAGAQFFDVATDKLTLDTVMKGLPEVFFDEDYVFTATAPHIQVVGADGFSTLYYYLQDGWYNNGTEDGAFKPGWCNDSGEITDLEITPGSGFWMKNGDSNDQTMIGFGAVSAPDSYNVTAPGGIFSINANVYPMSVDLNDLAQVEYPEIAEVYFDEDYAFTATAPHIQVVGLDGFSTLYYYLQDGWYNNGTEDGAFKPGWCNDSGEIVDLVIAPQTGFWVKAPAAGMTIKYKK